VVERKKQGSFMGITLPFKQFLSIGCCLLVASGLAAQPTVPQARESSKAQAAQVNNGGPKLRNDEDVIRLLTEQRLMEQLRHPSELQLQPYQVERPDWTRWRWLGYAIIAAAGALGGVWGASQTKNASPVADLPKPRVERLSLGADGTHGVWLREVFPWEEKAAAAEPR
jgi:hypothetical protein